MLILAGNFVLDFINTQFHAILLWIDSVVYWAVSKCYDLFMTLASARIFEDAFFADFARRTYAILGVFMLFYLAYALLNAIVDPEKYSKGEKGAGNIAINFVISLVLLGLVPAIFSYSYRLQSFILSKDIIGAIVLGSSVDDADSAKVTFGNSLSFTVLNTFINPDNAPVTMGKKAGYSWWDCKKDILESGDYGCLTGLAEPYINNNTQGAIQYHGVISALVGAYLVYVLLSFTLDLGVRVIKLAFYQLIAPIPIIMRIIPSKKGSFDKWLKKTLSTYGDVFIRVGFMYMCVYFISRIINNTDLNNYLQSGAGGLLVLCVIILGIFTFAKQVLKEVSDILGVDAKINMGIKDKLKASTDVMNKTPIVGAGMRLAGKGVGAVTGVAAGAAGALTGALGAGWTALTNKGDIKKGMKYGALKGFAGKGNQFGAMRQGLYTDAYKLEGKAGWFGGRNYLEQQTNLAKSAADNQFRNPNPEKGANAKWLDNYEHNNSLFMEEFNKVLREKNAERIQKLQEVEHLIPQYTTELQSEKDKLAGLQTALKEEQAKLERDKSNRIANLKAKIVREKNTGKRELLLRELNQEEQQTVKSEKLVKLQTEVQTASTNVESYQSRLSKAESDRGYYSTEITDESLRQDNDTMKSIRAEVQRKDPNYKARVENLRQERIEKSVNEELQDDQVAIQQELGARQLKKAGIMPGQTTLSGGNSGGKASGSTGGSTGGNSGGSTGGSSGGAK